MAEAQTFFLADVRTPNGCKMGPINPITTTQHHPTSPVSSCFFHHIPLTQLPSREDPYPLQRYFWVDEYSGFSWDVIVPQRVPIYTLPPTMMVQWKMAVSPKHDRFLSF